MVNMRPLPQPDEDWMQLIQGDACTAVFPHGQFDIVISNSLLEHVGGHMQRERLAEVILRNASRHWVQTPNRYFPIEPHWFFPGFQFLPVRGRVLVSRFWPLSHRRAATAAQAAHLVAGVELIGPGEMRRLFPSSEIWVERFAGLPKSIVAICA